MINGKSVLAIIPARSGSKGIPNKNIRLLNGKPLIAWTIDAAKDSQYIDKIIVTTDSKNIAKYAKKHKADVPFLRPSELATDNTSGIEVIRHALKWHSDNNLSYDWFIYLQPTSPFRRSIHIDEALLILAGNQQSTSLRSVCEAKNNPFWMRVINAEGFLEEFIATEKLYHNRQNLPKVFMLNGAIYISDCAIFLKYKSFNTKCIPYIMDHLSSIDIDTEDDWQYADFVQRFTNLSR